MDREFMSDYYEMRYESLMTGAEQFEDPEYRLASTHLREAEDELAKLIGGVGTDGWCIYERCIDAHHEIEGLYYKQLYLAGAEDREKMLR